jgi:hypothetical protein
MASFRPMSDPGVLRDAAADEDADLVAIVTRQPAFLDRIVDRQYRRVVGREPAPAVSAASFEREHSFYTSRQVLAVPAIDQPPSRTSVDCSHS